MQCQIAQGVIHLIQVVAWNVKKVLSYAMIVNAEQVNKGFS